MKLLLGLSLLLAMTIVGAWVASRPAVPDAFYDHLGPRESAAGTLLKSEPFAATVPAGARAWRILYVTSQGGSRTVASAVVVVPQRQPGPLPVVAWAHGTTGVVAGCAPSLMAKPFDNVPDMGALVREGWAYVATDYPGLGTAGGHSYLVGEDAAHAVLDAVRAARQLKDVSLGDRLVVWGHSQGGNSALWVGSRASELAPELRVLGVAGLAPATDLKGLMTSSKGTMFGKVVSSYLVTAYARAYPDVKIDQYVSGLSRLIADDIAARCVGGYETLFSVLETYLLPADGIFSQDPASGPLGVRLTENTPAGIIPAPLLIAQGEADDLVAPTVQKRFVATRCSAGQRIEYRSYPGRDHVTVVAPDSPLADALVQWTRDRLEGKPAASNCPT